MENLEGLNFLRRRFQSCLAWALWSSTWFKNWIRRLLRFGPCCDRVSTVGGGVRKAGFEGGGGVTLSLSGFWEIAACVNSGDTLKGLRGVENAVVAVEESCVLDVKSGTVLIISSGRVLAFNYSLKARYLFCNWKYRLAFSSSRRSFRENTSSMLPCISCIAGRSLTGHGRQEKAPTGLIFAEYD